MKKKETSSLTYKIPDYSTITEIPGLKATREQLARLYQRYHLARKLAEDREVLEIGCGAGLGLGYVAQVSKRVVGVDIEEKNVSLAKQYYKDRPNISIDLMDAYHLPLPDGSFDLALLYETIYYLKDPEKCIVEAARVLMENGVLIICTVNKDWEDFHPSPFTYRYFSASELYQLMKNSFREVTIYGGFHVDKVGTKSEIISLMKRFAVKFSLIPGSLKTRAYLKRVFMGRLIPLPNEVTEGMAEYEAPVEIPEDRVNRDFKILYGIGRK
jgi:ubiquinone/menaquinone biosynthesis C-methylase UbiE